MSDGVEKYLADRAQARDIYARSLFNLSDAAFREAMAAWDDSEADVLPRECPNAIDGFCCGDHRICESDDAHSGSHYGANDQYAGEL